MTFDLPFPISRADWTIKTLAELCGSSGGIQTGPFGSQLHAADYVERGIPSIMPMNITIEGVDDTGIARISDVDAKRLSRHLVADGDIVYSRRGDVEKCALITENEVGWLCGTGCLRVRLGEKAEVSPAFLHAYLSHPAVRQWIAQRAVGATMPNLNTGILSSLPVLIPDRDTWMKIGLFWRRLILKQNLNRRMNCTIEHVVQAIFKSWFVDFGPVRAKVVAKAEGFDPLRAAMCIISGKPEVELDQLPPKQFARLAGTAALFPGDLVESDFGEIPEGWEVTELGRLCSRISMGPFGSDIKRENFIESGVPLIRGGNLTNGLVEDGYAYISEEKANELRTANAYPEDIVITHRGTLGQIGIIPRRSRYARYVVSQSQMLLSVDRSRTVPSFVFEFLRSPAGQHRLLANTSQVGVPAIARPTTSLKAVPVVVSDVALARRFDELVQPLWDLVVENDKASRTLASLRETLLPKLFGGELSIDGTDGKK